MLHVRYKKAFCLHKYNAYLAPDKSLQQTYIALKVSNGIQLAFALSLPMALLFSCKELPETDFSYTPSDNPEAGEIIFFENTTPEASSYAWDFGDGSISVEENPRHTYEDAGNYVVELTASNDDGDQDNYKHLTINEATILAFLIVDSTETIPLEGAELRLYDNEADWDEYTKPMLVGYADSIGLVEFRNLENTVYYIWAFRDEPDGSWVMGGYTPALILNTVNGFYLPCVWFSYLEKKTADSSPHNQFSSPAKLLRNPD